MATCFLFEQTLDEERGWCLRLDERGLVDVPLASYTLDEIRLMQDHAETIVVLSAVHSTLHEVPLPWLSERKARLALPYALEEQLAQSVAHLHFAFDRSYYRDGRYLVAVIDKHWMERVVLKLEELHLDFDAMTLDWFALRENETCVAQTSLLVNDATFRGALTAELTDSYFQKRPEGTTVLAFLDSALEGVSEPVTRVDEHVHSWIAKRLFQNPGVNLCQGAFRHDTRGQTNQFWYGASAILVIMWLLGWLTVNLVHSHTQAKQLAVLDQQIAVIYHEFYPNAARVISPEFRIKQLLKSGPLGQDATFWPLLQKLAQTFDDRQARIEQFRFQNKILSVTLMANDFAALETLQLRLQQAHVVVTQAQASSSKQKVMATLELHL